MTDDLHTLSGAYALDALDEVERITYQRHLAGCDACATEVAGFQATTARMGAAEEVTPPPELRSRVLEAVSRTPQRRPRPADRSAPPARRRRLVPLLAAAAATVLVLGAAVFGVVQRDRADEQESQLAGVTAVLAAPDAQMSSAPARGGGRLGIVQSDDLSSAVMVISDLPALDDEHDYQVWTQRGDGPMTSAGMVARADTQKRSVHLMHDVDDLAAVAISVEPAGGSAEPTTDPIVVLPAG